MIFPSHSKLKIDSFVFDCQGQTDIFPVAEKSLAQPLVV
jgi:hypothetical protein